MATKTDPALLASELRVVLGQLMRRLRAEHGFPLSHGAVLGRLDREGPQSVSDLAAAERVRPQSMAQTVGDLEADGLVIRTPDPDDRPPRARPADRRGADDTRRGPPPARRAGSRGRSPTI